MTNIPVSESFLSSFREDDYDIKVVTVDNSNMYLIVNMALIFDGLLCQFICCSFVY